MTNHSRLLLLFLLLLSCALAAFAQTEDVINDYHAGWAFLPQLTQTVIFSAIYLAFYAAALGVTLSYLRLYLGFDSEMIQWMLLLWLGGLAINAFVYGAVKHFTHLRLFDMGAGHHLIAALIALPLIFAWSVFLATRNFSDLTLDNALRVSLVIALVCAPYFGPTWKFEKPSAVVTSYRHGRVEISCSYPAHTHIRLRSDRSVRSA